MQLPWNLSLLHITAYIALQSDGGTGAMGVLYEQGSCILHAMRYPPLFEDNGPNIMH